MREKIGKYTILFCLIALFTLCLHRIVIGRNLTAMATEENKPSEEADVLQSKIEPEDCHLCGKAPGSIMGYYQKLNSVGVLFLNNWNITDAQAIALDDNGKETQCDGSNSTVYNSFGDGHGSIRVNSQKQRGISHIEIQVEEKNHLDLNLAAKKLCQSCLNQVTNCFPDLSIEQMKDNLDLFLLDFTSRTLYYLREGKSYITGDYYVECEQKGDKLSLFVVYAPEREVQKTKKSKLTKLERYWY